jgi:predicted ATPase/DNA-binding SARP family transcriptional activator
MERPMAIARTDVAVPLRVRTLGGFAVWRGAELIPPERWSRRPVATLIKILLGAPGWRLHREQLIDLLWPDAEPEVGAHRLRDTLHRLRRLLDVPGQTASYVRSVGDLVALAPMGMEAAATTWLDAAAFAEAATAALAQHDLDLGRAALTLYTGDYLPDDLYEDWAAPRRDEMRRQYVALLQHVAALGLVQGDTAEAVRCLQAVLAADPCHEEAAAALMQALRDSGRRAEALRVYDGLAGALRDELGVSPSATLAALHAELLRGDTAMAVLAEATQPQRPRSPRSNLPVPLSSFIGREREVRDARHLLETTRLLTLTGVGGCGKTRLALQVAHALLPTFRDGVWLVDLAPLSDGAYLASAIAASLGTREEPGRPLAATLTDALRGRHLLLVLDNCEHLVAVCAELAAGLLAACPTLRLLATSREVLGITGEIAWQVPPLTLPNERVRNGRPSPEDLGAYEAVQLFVARAAERRPGFGLTEQNAAAVAEVVCRLDGLPLAIELAAARLAVMSVNQLADRLDDRFRLLSGGGRTALPHHRTLRATLDWSYDLLSAAEQVLLRRLAVFAGGCTLEVIEAVSTGDQVGSEQMLDLLDALVAKSLVEVREREGKMRFGLLETVRAYAAEQLAASAELDAVARAHAAYFVTLAEAAESELRGPGQVMWLKRLEDEHDNLRAALRWTLQSGEAAVGWRLGGALWWFWYLHGHISEGRDWLARLQAVADSAALRDQIRARAQVLNGAGVFAALQGDYAEAEALHEESIAICQSQGDTRGAALSVNALGVVASSQNEFPRAESLYAQAEALYREVEDTWGTGLVLSNRGHLAHQVGDYARAAALLEESLALFRRVGDARNFAFTLSHLGKVTLDQGDDARAVALYEESLMLRRDLGDTWGIAIALKGLGDAARAQGDWAQAATHLEESLVLFRRIGDTNSSASTLYSLSNVAREQGELGRAASLGEESLALFQQIQEAKGIAVALTNLGRVAHERGDNARAEALYLESLALYQEMGTADGVAPCLEALAEAAHARGQPRRAARLWGAAAALRAALGAPLPSSARPAHDRSVAATRAALGEAAFAAAWAAGQTLSVEQAIAEAPTAAPSP